MDREDEGDITDEQLDQFLLLIRQNPRLEELRLPHDLFDQRNDALKSALTELPRLKSLTFIGASSVIDFHVALDYLKFLFGLPTLQTIRLPIETSIRRDDYDKEHGLFEETLVILQQHMDTGRFPLNLKELELPWYADRYPEMFIVPFFKLGLHDLETFHVPRVEDGVCSELRWVLFDENHSLHHIRCTAMGGEPNGEDAEMLSMAVGSCDYVPGLQSVELNCMEWDSELQCSMMSSRDAILSLVFKNSQSMPSQAVQLIFAGCPLLEHFYLEGNGDAFLMDFKDYEIYDDDDEEVGEGEEEEFVEELDTLEKNFACLGLKTLHLIVATPLPDAHPSTTRPFYWQIGRLRELEELTFGYNGWVNHGEDTVMDYTLDPTSGRLNELKNLKKLKRLHLSGLMWEKIGQCEVEWMEQYWPSLERFVISTLNRPPVLEEEKPHWKWFMEKRPRLKVRTKYHFEKDPMAGL